MKSKYLITSRILLSVFIILISMTVKGQESTSIKSNIEKMMTSANIKTVTVYFQGYVDVEFPNFQGVVNELKAENLLRDFLKKEQPTHYSFQKDGFTGNSYYLIGNFKSNNKARIIYFLFKKSSSGYILQQLEIE